MEALTPNHDTMKYSIEKLIQMRIRLPVVCCIVQKLNKHPDIAVLLRIPKEAFTDPENYLCKSSSLVGMKNRLAYSNTTQRDMRGLSDDSGDQVIRAGTTSGSQRVKWNLRPRESSDRCSQPHSAPTDLAAQQSENFKRFYRAVVSPSHVRVTAGGRIVPNTRAIGAPLFEWNNEKQIYESRKPTTEAEFKPFKLTPLLPATSAFAPGYPQLLPAGFFPAYNQLAQSSLQPLTATAVQNLGSFGGNAYLPAPSEDSPIDAPRSAGAVQPIKISHPSQFDHSKPFMFNGQVLYPIPPGHLPPAYAPPVPVSIIGNPGLVPGAIPAAGFFIPQPAAPTTSSHDLNAASYGQNTLPPVSHTNPLAENGALYNPYLPLAGPTSVADITKFQIEGFRNHLSLIDEQLANNQLGIDVQYLEGQRSDLKALIERMEAMLTLQLAYSRRQDAGALLNGIMQFDAQNQLVKGIADEALPQDTEKDTGASSAIKSMEPAALSSALMPRLNMRSDDSESQNHPADGDNITKGHTRPGSKSRLTPAAAMAPPFQPRPQAMVAANSFSGISSPSAHCPTDTASFGPQITNWTSSAYVPTSPEADPKNIPGVLSTKKPSVAQNKDPQVTSTGVYTTDEQYTTPSDQATPLISPAAVPYLVGTVPPGVQGVNSKAADPQYPRPLTDEERRARFLYWGRAPRSAYGGLPKFDGKDFYPPSPSKEPNRLRPASPIVNTHGHRHLTPIERNFEKLFAAPGAGNHKATSLELINDRPDGDPSITPLAAQGSSVGSFRSQRSLNTPKGHSRPWNMEAKEVTYGLGAALPVDHRKVSPAHPDLSKSFINMNSSKPNSPGSARLSVRQFNSDTARAKYEPRNIQLDAENGELNSETKSVGSWKAPTQCSGVARQSSPRDIRSTPGVRGIAGGPGLDHNFLNQKESSSSSEQHAAFLQNMLKSPAQMGITAPALRTLSSATAHGFLPHYRGSAAASLAPAMLSVPGSEHDSDRRSPKIEQQGRSGDVRGSIPGLVNENQRLQGGEPPGPHAPDALDAEGYMRYLTQRADEDRRITEHGWNANASGSRHTQASNW